MTRVVKHFMITLAFALLIFAILVPVSVSAQSEIAFSEEEEQLIERTQNGNPLKIGIIPHAFPLSECPPDSSDYTGINIEMLSLITKLSGLQFEYGRIPLEEKTPFESLKNDEFSLVAGTIRLESFVRNPALILSDRFCDGSSICISRRDTNANTLKAGKIAVLSGYQAGKDFSEQQFPNHEIIFYPNNHEVMKAVRTGAADLAMISRYAGIYEMQNPMNDNLVILAPYQTVVDSCIMGLNTPENQTAVSIINKTLAHIGEDEYNHIQMNFSISHPYNLTFTEFLYKYRYPFILGGFAFLVILFLSSKLLYSKKDQRLLSRDSLTGAFTESGFELAAGKIIPKSDKPLFITDFDVYHFSSYNELHGKKEGDMLLKKIVKIVCSFLCEQDVICRSYADNFKVLSCKNSLDELIADVKQANMLFDQLTAEKIILNFGIYQITDPNVPISKMLDFAAMAKKSAKHSSQTFVCVFNEKLLEKHINDAKLLASFDSAINNNEFVAFYQPKFDTFTQRIVGAEALVRWIPESSVVIPPSAFIELFEKNGQIRRLDFHVLEQVCKFQKGLVEQGISPVPISVNFSRVHLYSREFVPMVCQIVERYGLPKHLIEIECTETTMTFDAELTCNILGALQKQGFSIAMDDFGKAYSSLNALCAMPLDIIKLDGGFLLATLENESEKSNTIINSMVSLLHELSLKVVAECVETEEQYLFLKSVGCDFIQGYYFAKPLAAHDFFSMLEKKDTATL